MRQTDILAILIAARDLISKPERWTPNADAIDGAGRISSPWHKDAVRWSVRGAIYRFSLEWAEDNGIDELSANLSALGIRMGAPRGSETHAEAIAMLDGAIADLSASA